MTTASYTRRLKRPPMRLLVRAQQSRVGPWVFAGIDGKRETDGKWAVRFRWEKRVAALEYLALLPDGTIRHTRRRVILQPRIHPLDLARLAWIYLFAPRP